MEKVLEYAKKMYEEMHQECSKEGTEDFWKFFWEEYYVLIFDTFIKQVEHTINDRKDDV